MPVRLDQVEVGSRVAYEDMANPREGRVAEILEHGSKTTPSGLPLPGGTEYRVVWDDARDGAADETTSDLRQHGWTMLADLPGNPFDGADIISVYTRLDAIRDGQIVPTTDLTPDEPDFARQAGWTVRVDLTRAVAELVLPTEREQERGQDVKGRLWDLLHMAAMYGRDKGERWLFPCIFQLAGPERSRWTTRAGQKKLVLGVVLGGDEDGPVATVMFPEED